MLSLPETRFDFCGDEYIFAQITNDMSAESNFKAIAITNELRRRNIPGIIEIYPANASYLVRYDPEALSPFSLLDYLKEIDITKSDESELNMKCKIVEIPIWYDDPVTKEYSIRFNERNKEITESNFDFVMKLNGFKDKDRFIDAHSKVPHLITMLGFTPGTAWTYPLGIPREEIIRAPKYTSPRTQTPKLAIGIGGAFSVIYPTQSPGSYQLIGMSAVPVYEHQQRLEAFKDSIFLASPGDLWKYRTIDESEYRSITKEVEDGTYRYKMKDVHFSAEEYIRKEEKYLSELMEDF
ncbi:5-oxoprolinase subunit B family protein [Pseudalkalibacillus salsuginis]|uniref:5-oxoprolinase subunit B family protein n=1 Tax=Pseudalkalibacillus salsuginis TaxID=2910972 RepID=UPI001F469E18|nr:carboxyltransferase domain-containing protein [Pseudalkalibacillus salsuginis]MCF6412029.1 carboxyltransferase domain-containing protein [Pseudalkalibacillus salsuginis]